MKQLLIKSIFFYTSIFSFSTNVFGQQVSVGGTSVSVNVDGMGSSTATIPVFCPPGRMGMQPQVSLNYNSNSGNGLLGKNMSYSGTSVITRVGNNYHIDGKQRGVTLNNTLDNFELDGIRLIWVGGKDPGTRGSIYRTEIDQFTKITFYEDHFIAELKDGGKLFYGLGGNSNLVSSGASMLQSSAFYLYRKYDLNGNYIEYNYNVSGGQIQLSTIKYTGYDATLNGTKSPLSAIPASSPFNSIQFAYKQAVATNKVWVNGTSILEDKVLDKVEVYEATNKVREYNLTYESSSYNNYLTSIEEKNKIGDVFEPITFNWQEDWGMYAMFGSIVKNGSIPTSNYDNPTYSGDFNGDGKTDVLIIDGLLRLHDDFTLNTSHDYKIYTTDAATSAISSFVINSGKLFNTQLSGSPTLNPITKILVGDVSQDGLDDIVLQTIGVLFNGDGSMYYEIGYHAMIASLDNVGKLQFGLVPNYFALDIQNNYYPQYKFFRNESTAFDRMVVDPYLGDCDGDGMLDLIEISKKQETDGEYFFKHLKIVYGKNRGAKYELGFPAGGARIHNEFPTDFDGDGKTDITIVFDNFTDIIYTTASNANWDYLYHSGGFPTRWHKGLQTGDFNGDGKTDFLCYTDKWYLAYSTGLAFDTHDAQGEFGFDDHDIIEYNFEGTEDNTGAFVQVGDYNGDGKSDVLMRHYHSGFINGHYGSSGTQNVFYSTGYNFLVSDKSDCLPTSSSFDYRYSLFGDFNGDGKTDVFSRPYIEDFSPATELRYTIDYFTEYSKRVEKILPNNKSEHVFKFKALPQSSQFKKANGFVFDQTVSVVSRIWITEEYMYNVYGVSAASQKYRYYYNNLLYSRHGRGMMGFLRNAVVNVKATAALSPTIVTENKKDPEYTYKLNPQYVKTYQGYLSQPDFVEGVNLLAQQELFHTSVQTIINPTQTQISISPNIIFIHFPYVNKMIETDYIKQVRKHICYEYDENGNMFITKATHYVVANYSSVEHINTTHNLFEAQGSWLPFMLKKTKNTAIRYYGTAMATPYTAQVDFTNNSRNHVLVSQKHVTTPSLWVANSFVYDGYGNITHKKIDYLANVSGAPITTETYTYNANGRFVSSIKNGLNQTSYYTFEPVYGNKISETLANGLTTTHDYDAWGRLIGSALPTDVTTTVLRNWYSIALPTFVTANTPSFYVYTSNNLGEGNWVYYDKAGRQIATKSKGSGGAFFYTDVQYDADNRISKESNTYEGPAEKIYTEISYDAFNRPVSTKYNNVLMASYTYDKTAISVTTKIEGRNVTKTTKTYATGHTSNVTDAGGDILYNIGSHNLPLNIQTNGSTTTFTYNDGLKQTQLCDPNAGCTNYEYNALGQLVKQIDANSNEYTMEYDILGRLVKKSGGSNEEYNYSFSNSIGDGGLNQLQRAELKIEGNIMHVVDYEYGSVGELLSIKEEAPGEFTERIKSYTYDDKYRIDMIIYPNLRIQNTYDVANNHVGIVLLEKNGVTTNTMLWEKIKQLPDGKTTQFNFGNGYENTINYNANRQLSSILSRNESLNDNAVNIEYTFELQSGNLTRKVDYNSPIGNEEFYYDNADRLVQIVQVDKENTQGFNFSHFTEDPKYTYIMEYGNNGNIKGKYDAGTLTYDGSLPHAVTSHEVTVSRMPYITPTHYVESQNITYNAFNKVAYINQAADALEINFPTEILFNYGVDEQRIKMEIKISGDVINTTHYINSADMELVNEEEITYLYAEGNPIAMHRLSDNAIYYLHVDYQGSLLAISNEEGAVLERRSYDAWGRPRRLDNYEYNLSNPFGGSSSFLTMRGYTFHEHLEMVGLINMNGRVYDPLLGRVLSPDNFVQEPNNTQSFNRYSYCLNNPNKYTDKNGYWFGYDDAVAAGVGFAVGYVAYGATTGNWGWKAVAAGGVGAAVAWVGWNTMGAGAAALGQAGSATSFSAGTSAVFGSAGGYFGVQYAVLTGLNTMMHKEQLNSADENGWGGVAAFGAYSISAMLSMSLHPLSVGVKSSGLGIRQWAGVVLTNNISDNMENGELKFHSLHVGPIGYDTRRNDKTWGGTYTIFSNGLSKGQRFDMAFETILGLSQVKSDIDFWTRKPEFHRPFCGKIGLRLGNPNIVNINTAQIGYYANRIMELWNASELVINGETLHQRWYNQHYNEDGSAKY